jgi:SAM-dependent methyltransferase
MSSEEHPIRNVEEHWERKYEQGLPSLTNPDPFWVSVYANIIASRYPSQGRTLDLAGGLGRHSLLLAEAGWMVSLVDISRIATQYVESLAQSRGLPITVHRAHAASFDFEPLYFDLVVLFYHFDRLLFRSICECLKPGGMVVSKLRARREQEETSVWPARHVLGSNEIVSLLSA